MFDSLLNELGVAPAKKIQIKTNETEEFKLVLFNDDVNTFEYVIDCLVAYCDHDTVQAEQCAFLVHYKGKCIVKNGSKAKLTPICNALSEKGLTVEIQ
jgi:ATP-dependent Clp protease adaptor protein ClpS